MAALRLCIVVASCYVALNVAADESTGWRALYRDGSRQYDLGDFRAALDLFKRAYLAHEEAGILFDIGECHRQLGESAEAVHAYQSYLRRKPDAANRADVEALIAKLQGAPAPSASLPVAFPSPTA
jgi:tetratricopeptide (TPR) repeat protein